jgi:3-hydroxyacyl-[acyl-carrier-protein] dehydratase
MMLENKDILARIPHGFPFVFVDRVVHLEEGVRAVALKNVTVNERFFLGHFPSEPILPGVLIIEAMAQVGGLVVAKGDKDVWFLAEVKDMRFKQPVVPGDQLVLTVEVQKALGGAVRFSGRAVVGERVAAEGEFTLARPPA